MVLLTPQSKTLLQAQTPSLLKDADQMPSEHIVFDNDLLPGPNSFVSHLLESIA